jgi:hypothetical protein
MKTLKQVFFIVGNLAIIVGIVLIGVYVYWQTYPYKVITISEDSIPISPTIVKPGDYVNLTIKYCKYLPLPATVSQTFEDDLIYTRPTFITNNPTGCKTSVTSTQIPLQLPNGTYTIKQIYSYQVNPVRVITVTSQTIPFKIAK